MSNQGLGLYFRATGLMYWECMKGATALLRKNWPILIGSVVAYLVFIFSAAFFAPLGFGGGFLIGFIQIALVSLYYGWISDCLQSEKLDFPELTRFDYHLFFTVISAAFIIFIAQFLFSSIAEGTGESWVMDLVQLGIVLIFNALPETIYIHRFENIQALSHSADFTRTNWIEWFLPYAILLSPLLLISPELVLLLLSRSQELMPALTIFHGLNILDSFYPELLPYLTAAAGILIGNWYMLFRGLLYKELEGSTRRKRMFDAKS